MRFAISIPQFVSDGEFDPARFRAYMARAEALGFESAWTLEQTLGTMPFMSPLQTMSYAAACTERIRLGCVVFVTPLHSPVHLAKDLSTLDQLSRGRIDVGVGTGGRHRMFSAFQVDPTSLVARFNEGLRLMKALWTEPRVNFDGRFWQLKDAGMEPKPFQKPHPPIWFGASHPDALRRAARHGHGFFYWSGNIPWVSPKDMKERTIYDTIDKITAEAVTQSATRLVDRGAVLLVVRSGILNHSIPVAIAGRQVTLNQDLKALIPRREISSEYLSYFIDGMQGPLLVEWRKEGATVESLELELIANTRVPILPVEEQRAIAVFLDRETAMIHALVAKKELVIELLHEKRSALITQAVTKGLDPNIPMKDSGVEWLGEIPIHWTVAPLYSRY